MKCPACGVEIPAGLSKCPGCTYNTSAEDGGRAWRELSPEKQAALIRQSREEAEKKRKSSPLLCYADEHSNGDPQAALEYMLRNWSLQKIRRKLYTEIWTEKCSKDRMRSEMREYLLPVVSRILDEGYPGGSHAPYEEKQLCPSLNMTPEQLREYKENPYLNGLKKQGLILLAVIAVCLVVGMFSVRAAAFLGLIAIAALGVSPGSVFSGTLIAGLQLRSLQRMYAKTTEAQWENYRKDPELYDKVRDLMTGDNGPL